MDHIIVGTAGHVDHGKTQLTLGLTGVNTDRLPEEKKRGMTIELGFVPLQLKNGQRLGLIDVPGHERFVKTMLAGAAGMDMALLVVAADEGVMPQTREHLNILDMLGINKGVLVITKADLVEEDWLELIKEQTRELISGTALATAPLVAVSAHTGQGMEELLDILSLVAAEVAPKSRGGHPRLPIDRVFSKVGFGTVITGTLWQGTLCAGQAVEVWPGGRAARLRGLQVHGQQVEQALAGQRTAVNVSGLPVGALPRGGWLAAPKLLRESWRLDVELRLLKDAKALCQRCRLRLHHGTAEVLCRLQLLDREELAPGESCLCQLLLEKPLPPLRGDKLILRSYSPMMVVGGATVLDACPGRHKRYRAEVLYGMERSLSADTGSLLLGILEREGLLYNAAELAGESQLPQKEIEPLLRGLVAQGRLNAVIIDAEAYYAPPAKLAAWRGSLQKVLEDYHKEYPLRSGLPFATARSKYFPRLSQKQLAGLMEIWCGENVLRAEYGRLALADFVPQPRAEQLLLLDTITADYEAGLLNPPDWAEEMERHKVPAAERPEFLLWLTEQGLLIKVAEGVLF
ncbi:MAG: selenocysteine-specific translation elongation factor, partial [Clostridiales bacterium]|nr:selenocysteine-specific translation elongation factor [Clostridiales bacterium]